MRLVMSRHSGVPATPETGAGRARRRARLRLSPLVLVLALSGCVSWHATVAPPEGGTTNLGPTQFIVQDALIPSVTCPANVTLAPNQAVTCNAGYTTTQTDVTAGRIVSTASASGAGAATSQPVVTTIPYNAVTPPPVRLNFPAGNPSILTQPGTINTPGTVRYVFAASAGQTLTAQLSVPTNDINMAIYGPNNIILKNPDAVNNWNGTLPQNGDYFVDLVSSVGIPSKTYTLTLTLATTAPPSNTVRVADINPGGNSSSPSYLSPFNAQLYFQANGNANTGADDYGNTTWGQIRPPWWQISSGWQGFLLPLTNTSATGSVTRSRRISFELTTDFTASGSCPTR